MANFHPVVARQTQYAWYWFIGEALVGQSFHFNHNVHIDFYVARLEVFDE